MLLAHHIFTDSSGVWVLSRKLFWFLKVNPPQLRQSLSYQDVARDVLL